MSIELVMSSNHLILCQPSSPPTLSLSWHQSLFQWVGSLHQVAKVLELQVQHQSNEYSGLISFRIDWFDLLAVQGTLKESSPTPQFQSINSLVFSLLYSPTLTSIHDYWKNHSFDYTDLCWECLCFLIDSLGDKDKSYQLPLSPLLLLFLSSTNSKQIFISAILITALPNVSSDILLPNSMIGSRISCLLYQ